MTTAASTTTTASLPLLMEPPARMRGRVPLADVCRHRPREVVARAVADAPVVRRMCARSGRPAGEEAALPAGMVIGKADRVDVRLTDAGAEQAHAAIGRDERDAR